MQASVNLATETALVRVTVPKGPQGEQALKRMAETLAQVRLSDMSGVTPHNG